MANNGERNIMQIMILDQGVIQFNAKPREGIAFLIKNKVINEDPLEIAKFLATTDKLDKHVLGNFLGKDNDYSIAMLNKFASLFHYEGVPFDIALRTFTNRFAMPGESQMIYRILERFSVYYWQANQESSLDKDKALILSYALIMLNVDLHSNRVKAKMTKEEFVRNTELALGSAVSRDDLVRMYLRISDRELKPDTTAEEIVYSKLAVNPKYAAAPHQMQLGENGKRNEAVIDLLKEGAILLKYGREGSPHARKVFLSSDEKKLCWVDPAKLERLEKKKNRQTTAAPAGPIGVSLAGELVNGEHNNLDLVRSTFLKIRSRAPLMPESFKREIPLEDLTGLVVGTGGTRNFRRHFANNLVVDDVSETEQRCFSLITDYRTLDLQAPPSVDLAPWLLYFHSVLSEREKRLRASADKNRDIWSFTQRERASLVRWQEIVPQWAEHWNCGARVSAGGGYRTSQHPKEELLYHRMFLVNPSGFVLDRGQRLETAVSTQLVALWLEGIPSSVRPRIWPIATGNSLRLDDKYFSDQLSTTAGGSTTRRMSFSLISAEEHQSADGVITTPQRAPGLAHSTIFEIAAAGSSCSPESVVMHNDNVRFEKELERELKSSSMRKFANRALAWIDARGSREQQAFFKPPPAPPGVSVYKQRIAEASPSSLDVNFASSTVNENKSEYEDDPDVNDECSPPDTKSEDSWDSQVSPMTSGWENVYRATKILVSGFLTQRKDIKYVRGMAVLASMVIFNVGIQDLPRAFSVYSNILHQHYFFDFFTMRWRDMRMRFDLYSKLLRERMPYLDDHFNAIQITSDLYFNQWLLTGFTRVLPFRTVCRVWDGFLLLGESYFFTAALALLNYYEHSLMTSGFGGCLEILLGHADEVLFNDKKFFECVHAQSVSNERFAAWISAQRLAEEKTGLYDLLLLM